MFVHLFTVIRHEVKVLKGICNSTDISQMFFVLSPQVKQVDINAGQKEYVYYRD